MERYDLRPYQAECLEKGKRGNTIVCLPTGTGKTLIAVRLIEYYLNQFPHLKIAFLVPTRPLVEQQAEYCIKHCRHSNGNSVIVQRLAGEDQAKWDERMWSDALQQCHIMLGTAALFQKAFTTDKYIKVEQFSLLVFDECHNAVGNSPMAAVMRDSIIPFVSRKTFGNSPRVLGLTASFINGSLKNREKKRKDLEALLLSEIFCPEVESRVSNERYQSVTWDDTDRFEAARKEEVIGVHVNETCKKLESLKIREIDKVVKRCAHVFLQLGSDSLFYYVETVICRQIMAKVALLAEMEESVAYAQRLKDNVPFLRREMDGLSSRLRCDNLIASAPLQSNKLKKLTMLIKEILQDKPSSHCGIVFVEQVALVSALAKQLNEFFGSSTTARCGGSSLFAQCGAVAGTGYQTQADRQTQLDAFAQGKIRILVATAALEEGIDVPDCAFVIRYSTIATTKAHIQGSGRARHPNGEIYYFENYPAAEQAKESAMLSTARNTSLAMSDGEMQQEITRMNASVEMRHPYPFSGQQTGDPCDDDGVVNVFNCKQILNQYCSMALGKSISPKNELYLYQQSARDSRKILTRIRYPTPTGWLEMTEADYKTFWKGVEMDQVFDVGRSKKKTQSEREEMTFVYVVVVNLRERGWLDVHNKPEKRCLFDIKRNCSCVDPYFWNAGITLRDKVVQSASTV